MGRTLGYVMQTLGDVLDYFMGTRPTHGHAPKIEAVPGPTIQEQRQQTLRTSAETIVQAPNAQSFAQSMNADEDIRQRAAEIARQQRKNWSDDDDAGERERLHYWEPERPKRKAWHFNDYDRDIEHF